jgi:hypothetical protein
MLKCSFGGVGAIAKEPQIAIPHLKCLAQLLWISRRSCCQSRSWNHAKHSKKKVAKTLSLAYTRVFKVVETALTLTIWKSAKCRCCWSYSMKTSGALLIQFPIERSGKFHIETPIKRNSINGTKTLDGRERKYRCCRSYFKETFYFRYISILFPIL